MIDSDNNVPKLRFPWFNDAWEQRKFGELYQKVNEKNDLSFTKDKVISVANMYFKKDAEIRSDDSYMKTYNVFCKGDIAFEGNRNKQFSYGRFVENTIGDGIVSHVFDVFRPITEFDLNYWKYAIHNERVMGPILMTATTSSTMMTNLVAKDFLKRVTLVPSFSEQQKIGAFFQQLDNLITLHQRKLSDVKKLKSGLLQKMFPKNGENTPEVRFPEFTNAWEQRKLKDMSDETFGGGTPKTTVIEYWNGTIPWIQSSDLAHNKLFNVLPKKYVTENAIKNSATKIVPANSIAIVTRVGVGKLAFMMYEYTTSQDFLSLSNLNTDGNFSTYAIYKLLQKELNNIQGTSIKGITKTDLLEKNILISSSLNEQQKVGSFFKQLDNLITLHQRKLEHLQQQKKALLQQMFI